MSKQKALIFQTAVKNNTYSEFLTHYTIKELQTFSLHMFYNNTMGYAITPNREIANVFNNSLNVRHTGQAMVVDAIRRGGKTIFCFDGYPARLWKEIGFIEVKREKFNCDLAPESWEYSFYGYPDLLHLTFWPAMSEFRRAPVIERTYKTPGIV